MAGVINKPDALSLSGNMNKFVMSSGETIAFVLKKGDTILIQQSYEPGPDSLVSVDLKDIVESQLAYIIDAADQSYVQTSLAANFTATIDGTDYSFRAVRSGVASLSDTAANWLQLHFLTWQPRIKQVSYYQPEWLTYYAVQACAMKLKATFADNTTQTITLGACNEAVATTFNVQMGVVAGLLGNKYPSYYEVWAETASGTKLSESQIYAYASAESDDEQWFMFENSLGGLDTFRAYGTNDLKAEHTHNIATLDDVREEYSVDTQRKYTKSTGQLDDYCRHWLLDFFPSKNKYIYETSAIRKIVVTESNATYISSELPSSYTFAWQLAEVSTLLNLIKNEDTIPENLTAPDLSSPDFILPPRLVELPRVTLSEGVLIPAFNPNNPTATVTTFGAIRDNIRQLISSDLADELAKIKLDAGGSGGGSGTGGITLIKSDDTTTPTDENVFSSLRTLLEIKNRKNEWEIEAASMFLRKDIDDTAHGNITFDKSLKSTVYIDGWEGKGWQINADGSATFESLKVRTDVFLKGKIGTPNFVSGFTGSGWQIDGSDARATFDYTTVRKSMKVYELVYSQIYGLGGSVMVTDLNKIKTVTPAGTKTYTCEIDSMDNVMRMNLRSGDIVRMQRSEGINVRYFYGRISNISSTTFDLTIIDGEDIPETGDVVFRMGNISDTKRQGLLYLTSSDDYSPYLDVLDGVTDASFVGKTKVRLGNLKGITVNGYSLSGYGIYLNGGIFADCTYYLADGSTLEQKFEVLNGRLNSEISTVKNDLSLEPGNILKNSSFGSDTDYWSTTGTVHFINVSGAYLYQSGYFYVDKDAIADIYTDGSRNVLRIRNNTISQLNAVMSIPTHSSADQQSTYTYSFALWYKVLRSGTLTAGISGTDLYLSQALTVSDKYQKLSKVAQWDETGNFSLSFTGEILIYGVSLMQDALADTSIRLSTQIQQNASEILLRATKEYVDTQDGSVTQTLQSSISVQADKINAVSSRVTSLESASAGWITESEGNTLWATNATVNSLGERVTSSESTIQQNSQNITLKVSTNGVISAINQSSESVNISASKINFNGLVTANNNFKILTDGSMEAVNGKFTGYLYATSGNIGGFSINQDSSIYKSYDSGWGYSNSSFGLYATGVPRLEFLGPNMRVKIGLQVGEPTTTPPFTALQELWDMTTRTKVVQSIVAQNNVSYDCAQKIIGSTIIAKHSPRYVSTNPDYSSTFPASTSITSRIGYSDLFIYEVSSATSVNLPNQSQMTAAFANCGNGINQSYFVEITLLAASNSSNVTFNVQENYLYGNPSSNTSITLQAGQCVKLAWWNQGWYVTSNRTGS